MNFSARTVVIIAIGAALYGIGGLPMFGIPVFANTTLKPAMAILALFASLYGPVVGFFVGFIGHWVTDLFAGWGVWFTWVLGSGLVGLLMGFFPILTKNTLKYGNFNFTQITTFALLALFGNVLGYGVSAFLDTLLYAEPFTKVFLQLCIIAAGNALLVSVVGYFILHSVAERNRQCQNLVEADT